MKKKLLLFLFLFFMMNSCDKSTSNNVQITVTPASPSIITGATQQFTATASDSLDITSTATWTSSDTEKATINSSGLATAIAPGTTTITATLNGVSGSATLTIAASYAYVVDYLGNKISEFIVGTNGTLTLVNADAATGLYRPVSMAFNGSYAYVTESENISGSGTTNGSVFRFSVGANGILTNKTSVASSLDTPFGIAFNGSYVYVIESNGSTQGGAGSISQFTVGADGTLTAKTAAVTGLNYPTAITFNGSYAYVTEATTNKVLMYTVGASGALGSPANALTLPAASNPFAITFNGSYAYVSQYLADKVSKFSVNSTTGALTTPGTDVATLTGPTVVSFNGSYAYVPHLDNRINPNTIHTIPKFSVDSTTGALTADTDAATGLTGATVIVFR